MSVPEELDVIAGIIADLAGADPEYVDRSVHRNVCALCGAESEMGAAALHDPECPWLRAQRWLRR